MSEFEFINWLVLMAGIWILALVSLRVAVQGMPSDIVLITSTILTGAWLAIIFGIRGLFT
jgi:hypothetical protein